MPRFLIIGFIILLTVAANAQRAYISNPQADTTLMPPAIWQDGKLISASPRQYIEEYGENDPPMSCLVYPDSNFIRRGFGYPTSPYFQVMANYHIYTAQGGYVVIYEIGNDGLLTKTGQKATHSLIRCMAHDGNYLYVSTLEGFEIFDGTNYIEPARIGENWLGVKISPIKFSVYGDSAYYYYYGNYTDYDSTKFGIMDISDRTNPRVVYTSGQMYYYSGSPPQKYQNYLVITGRQRNDPLYSSKFFILDLTISPGNPQIVDSLHGTETANFRIFGNRLYTGLQNLKIYEFDYGTHLIFRGTIGEGSQNPKDIYEFIEGQDTYCLYISNFNKIYKARVSNLSFPVIVDSIVESQSDSIYLRKINLIGNKVYLAGYDFYNTSHSKYGIYVYDWALANPNRLIQWIKGHTRCTRVTLYGNNVAYVGTSDYEVLPIDLSDMDHPRIIEDACEILSGFDPKISGDILFTKNAIESTYVYSITAFSLNDPLHPETLWTYSYPQYHFVVQAEIQDSLLIASYFGGWPTDSCHLEIINMANPLSPEVLCDTALGFLARYFYMQYPRLYFIDNDYEKLRVVSIENPRHPTFLGNYSVGSNQTVQAIAHNNYLYVYDQLYTYIYDNSHFGSYRARYFNTGGYMDISNGALFFCGFTEAWHGRGLYGWDIAHYPLTLNLNSYSYYNGQGYTYMKSRFPYVFLTGGWYGLIILEYQRSSGIESDDPLPTNSELSLNAYPNPFNEQVRFYITSENQGNSELDIYDIVGRRVWSSIEINEERTLLWHAVDQAGKLLPSGIYFARLTQGENQVSKKIVLLK